MGEIKAIFLGLEQVEAKGWSNIICSDSIQAGTSIIEGSDVRDVNFLMIKKCRNLLKKLEGIQLEYEPRAGNKATDRLAKYCRKNYVSNYVNLWEVPPDSCLMYYWRTT